MSFKLHSKHCVSNVLTAIWKPAEKMWMCWWNQFVMSLHKNWKPFWYRTSKRISRLIIRLIRFRTIENKFDFWKNGIKDVYWTAYQRYWRQSENQQRKYECADEINLYCLSIRMGRLCVTAHLNGSAHQIG